MATATISGMTSAAALTGAEVVEVVQSGDNYKLLLSALAAYVIAVDPELAAFAGLVSAADRLPYYTGSGTAALATFTAAGRALVDDANAAAQLATLGAAPLASPALTGAPTAPTPAVADNDTSIATTAFVQGEFAARTGAVVDSVMATYATNASLTVAIPNDDTIPQVGEGTEIISASYTAKSATNKLRCRFQGEGSMSGAGSMVAALFLDGGANAIAASATTIDVANYARPVLFEHEFVPGDTSAHTLSVRVGPNAGTLRLNGNTAARLLGGVMKATLVIEEIRV